jgi:hypothetical protein
MDERNTALVKADFLNWSGGFYPESENQIIVYIDYAMAVAVPEVDACRVLSSWMNEADHDYDLP